MDSCGHAVYIMNIELRALPIGQVPCLRFVKSVVTAVYAQKWLLTTDSHSLSQMVKDVMEQILQGPMLHM